MYPILKMTSLSSITKLVAMMIILANAILISAKKLQEPIIRAEILSPTYSVSWIVDVDEGNVTFVVTGATTGFVGFGLSPKGGMNDADVIIGGIDDDTGLPYFSDRFASGKQEPRIDDHQDWFLIDATQNDTHTTLTVTRDLDTCDDEDLPITNDTTKFIWSLGATDDIQYHQQRGAASVNILDYHLEVEDPSEFDIWSINVNTTLPNIDTVYWCTVHNTPSHYTTKRHIVGLEVKLDSQLAVDHNHHLILHKCYVRPGSPESVQLESYIGKVGGQCYDDDGTDIVDLMEFCNAYLFVWARGGSRLFLPENVGFPINEEGLVEYFLLEIHYDNPHVVPDLTYETGVTVYTTEELREHDAGLVTMGHDINVGLVVPPNSIHHMTVGHCSPSCTAAKIPEDGINLFNILLHSHFTGRKLKLRHFRPQGDQGVMKELAWIGVDNNFEFNYQQNRPLLNNVKVLPGDQLIYECSQESTYLKPPQVVLGGMKASDEMCETHVLYYPRITNLDRCGSTYPLNNIMPKFGIESVNWTHNERDPVVMAPAALSGHKYSTVLNTKVNWSEEFRKEFAQTVRFEDHQETCLSYNEQFSPFKTFRENMLEFSLEKDLTANLINYPETFTEYVPPPGKCDQVSTVTTTTASNGGQKLHNSFAFAWFGLKIYNYFS